MRIIIMILFFIYTISANAEIITDNPKGNIGESVVMNIKISKDLLEAVSDISSSFELSNPTVFYPDSVKISGLSLKASLERKNDSLYSFKFKNININDITGDTLTISLYGELLAGNDTLTIIDFFHFKINEKEFDTFESIIYSESIGPPLPYTRISTLEQNYPNPVFKGTKTYWSYRIDIETLIEFHVYNLIGQKVEVINLGIKLPGNYTYEFIPDYNYSAGLYRMVLKTMRNSDGRTFMVIK